jgi:hypothetical protein
VQENKAQVLARYLLQTNSLVPIPNSLVAIEKSTAKVDNTRCRCSDPYDIILYLRHHFQYIRHTLSNFADIALARHGPIFQAG